MLDAILNEAKFLPHGDYAGADLPEDRAPLQAEVDNAVVAIQAMPRPLQEGAVRGRLAALLKNVEFFATEDREEAHRYAVRIWRASGFRQDSGLFPGGDDGALSTLTERIEAHRRQSPDAF